MLAKLWLQQCRGTQHCRDKQPLQLELMTSSLLSWTTTRFKWITIIEYSQHISTYTLSNLNWSVVRWYLYWRISFSLPAYAQIKTAIYCSVKPKCSNHLFFKFFFWSCTAGKPYLSLSLWSFTRQCTQESVCLLLLIIWAWNHDTLQKKRSSRTCSFLSVNQIKRFCEGLDSMVYIRAKDGSNELMIV